MEYVECRTHDTICIEERIRLTVLERQRDSVTLSVIAARHSDVRFAHDALHGEAVDASHTRYLLPLLTGDCFTVDDIQVEIGLYLDRHEIAANDDCDIQLQISRLPSVTPDTGVHAGHRRMDVARSGGSAGCDEAGAARLVAEREARICIRRLRTQARLDSERSVSCSP